MTSQMQERAEASTPASAEEARIRRAKKRAQEIQGLYVHVLVYLVINAGLFVINLLTRGEGGTWWFLWPAAIWAIAVLIHAVVTYVPVFSDEWAERRAARFLEENRSR